MSSGLLLVTVVVYFAVLLAIAWWTSRGAGEHAFYSGERKSLWWVVAFGMVGTSLSGITFISVPGDVSKSHWTYLQVVFGYVIGYGVIAWVLLPLYYRMQVTSIYGYLRDRFGDTSYKTGSVIFLISRLLGATLRIYVVLFVIHRFLLESTGIPFWLTSAVVLVMIYLYTLQGGVKTIVWTDTLQTTFMLGALIGTIAFILSDGTVESPLKRLGDSGMTQVFSFDWKSNQFFLKQILSGIFITIAMTGLDQEMMQKNLSVRTLKEAQKNVLVFSIVLFVTNVLFLLLGGLLYIKAESLGIELPKKGTELFPTLALQHFPGWLGIVFIIGLISALFPSADGALTALTASTCIDLIGIRERNWPEEKQRRVRQGVHSIIAVLFFLMVLWFYWRDDESIIKTLLDLAGITYGPLLGLFVFGLAVRRKVRENLVPLVCVLAAVASYFLRAYSPQLFYGYAIGFEVLLINALLTCIGLGLISKRTSAGQAELS